MARRFEMKCAVDCDDRGYGAGDFLLVHHLLHGGADTGKKR
jgi:hypothetical protein